MKMNQTFNRFTAILLALLLFTGNAGMLSAVSAEELPFDPGITSEWATYGEPFNVQFGAVCGVPLNDF